ncbi:hypothetical protein [Wenyingzhuangia sp. IMCC45467]
MKEKKKIQYENWSEHLKVTKERTLYSSRRMDLLTISLSSAGIYIILELLKEVKKGTFSVENELVFKLSGIFFLVSIILNVISQQTAYYANKYEEEYIHIKIEEIKGEKIDKCELKRIDEKVSIFDKSTGILNFLSILGMFVGLISLAVSSCLF